MLLKAFVLVSTVLLLMSLVFSVLSSTPLLILKHDVPMDSRIIRQVFHYCYRMIAIMGAAAAIAFALAGRPLLSACLGSIALLAIVLHRVMLTRMDALRPPMHSGDRSAISRFRQLHVTGVALHLTQLVALTWGITQIAL